MEWRNKVFSSGWDIYYLLLLLLAISLPLSIFMTSLAEVLLVLNWLREGNFRRKTDILKSGKSVIFVFLIYAVHLLGMIHTGDLEYGLHDLRIKLPTLILPLVISTSGPVSEKKLGNLMGLFTLSVFASTIVSGVIFFGLTGREVLDYREISIFISHIRLALMVVLAAFCILYSMITRNKDYRLQRRYLLPAVLVSIWFVVFLIMLKSITGLIILIITGLIIGWKYSGRIHDLAPRFMVRVFIITIPLVIASFLTHAIDRYYRLDDISDTELEKNTVRGNPYEHFPENGLIENGHYVFLYLCDKELREGWNMISLFPYDGNDRKGQVLKYTLIRYMTSKGLRKDAAGIKQLSSEDIEAIENGLTNYIFLRKFSIYSRIYEIIWELDSFSRGDNPSGHSVAQRIIYLRAAMTIISGNPVLGVGTGDLKRAFDSYYDNEGKMIGENWRFRAHNQYITFIITFGFTGFIILMTGFLLPPFLEKRWGDYYFLCFILISLISFLTEDTLETQTGVSFFMFFYSLLLFGRERMNDNRNAVNV